MLVGLLVPALRNLFCFIIILSVAAYVSIPDRLLTQLISILEKRYTAE